MNDDTAEGLDAAFETGTMDGLTDFSGSDEDSFSDPEAFDAELASSGLNALAEPDGSVFMPSLSPETPIDSSESDDSAGSTEESEADGDKENLTADSADEAESTAKPKSGGDLSSLIDSMETANTDLANFLSGKPVAEPSNTDETGSPEDEAETAGGFSDITENADVPDTAEINGSIPESGSADNSDTPSASSDTAVPETEARVAQEPQEPLPSHLKNEIKSVLAYMDQLLESLPEEKIEEFAKSEYFDTYKRLFEELGIS